MFCPGCGEKSEDTTSCCTKCGLDLARLRAVIAEGDQNNSSVDREEALLSVGSRSDTISEDTPPMEVSAPVACEAAGFDNSDPVRLKDHGNELFRQEKYLDALDCYEKALAIDQFYKEAWFNKSIVLKKIGRPDQSKVCWGIYKRLSSGEPEAQKK
jgi:tetratricopeptide (TPR) repeat protein